MSAKAKTKLTPQQRKATLTRVLGKIKPYSLFVVCSLDRGCRERGRAAVYPHPLRQRH